MTMGRKWQNRGSPLLEAPVVKAPEPLLWNGGAGAAHFGIAVGGSGLRLLISEQLVLGAASRRSMPPAGPPARCFTRATYRAAPAQAPAHTAA
eukprot:COSAG04_NODE_23113_length_343_cov_3.934426_1_plen_92_part_10